MEFNKEQAQKFWNYATEKIGQKSEINLEDKQICKDDIKESIRRAFRDLTVRTMTKRDDATTYCLDDLAEKCDELLTQIENWFGEKPSQDKFDEWHKKTCKWVVSFLEKYYIGKDCTIGKAQKVVNMSFKNLYALCCTKGIEESYKDYFKFCHLPLDSFILEWFYRQCKNSGEKITKGKICSWSAIDEYGDENVNEYTAPDNKIFYTYYYFQKLFRKWFAVTLTPLQAEFMIWPTIQKELAAEGFLFSLKEDIDSKEKEKIKRLSLDDKISKIKKLL